MKKLSFGPIFIKTIPGHDWASLTFNHKCYKYFYLAKYDEKKTSAWKNQIDLTFYLSVTTGLRKDVDAL